MTKRLADVVKSIRDAPAWQQEAACAGAEPNTFFPMPIPQRGVSASRRRMQAKRRNKTKWHEAADKVRAKYCDGCSVKQECLEYAIALRINDGIWGGTTNDERRVIIRERRQAAG